MPTTRKTTQTETLSMEEIEAKIAALTAQRDELRQQEKRAADLDVAKALIAAVESGEALTPRQSEAWDTMMSVLNKVTADDVVEALREAGGKATGAELMEAHGWGLGSYVQAARRAVESGQVKVLKKGEKPADRTYGLGA